MKSRRLVRSFLLISFSCWWGFLLAAQDSSHLVLKGETLYGIAKLAGITVQELKTANNISDTTKVKIGQKLLIPGKLNDSGAPGNQNNAPPLRRSYIVKHGDTLYSIARDTGSEVSILLADNKIGRNSVLKIGQELRIHPKTSDIAQVSQNAPNSTAPILPDDKKHPDGNLLSSTTSPVPNADLSGTVTSGTSFQKTAYTQGASLNWPHPGERFTLNGKLPGILIKAQKGEVVKSVNSGKVVYSGPHSTFGHIVFVQSPDGFIYIYGGNENSNLKTGETVRAGDIIGTVGVTPGIQEPQVYFSVWKDGSYINPALVLRS